MVKREEIKVVTLTVNPAIDVHISMDRLTPGADHLGRITRRDFGGKGVNVSRALASLGRASNCVIALGRENGEAFAGSLLADGLDVLSHFVNGSVRENINIHTEDGDTVIATNGPVMSKADISALEDILDGLLTSPTILVFSGRIAEGTDREAIINMLLRAKGRSALLILDSRSLNASDIARLRPLLIKPNFDEAQTLLGHKIKEPIEAVNELLTLGAEQVLFTLGKDGLILSDGKETVYQPAIDVTVKSTVGAGDSTVASFIDSYIRSHSVREAAIRAACTSAAACMTDGTLPPNPCQINLLIEQIKNTPREQGV